MARACIFYLVRFTDKQMMKVCLFCAMQLQKDNNCIGVSLQTTEYEYEKCEECDEYIEDRIEI